MIMLSIVECSLEYENTGNKYINVTATFSAIDNWILGQDKMAKNVKERKRARDQYRMLVWKFH